MVPRKRNASPVTPELRARVLTAVMNAPEPVTASQLIKQLQGEVTVRPNDLAAILEDHVAAGNVFQIPPKTAKAGLRYWHRDPYELATSLLIDLIQSTEEPLTAKQLAQRLGGPLKFTERELTPLLQACVAEGKVFVLPAATPRGAPRYACYDLPEFRRRQIVRAASSGTPQTAAQLKKSVRGISNAEFASLLAALLMEHVLYRHPPHGGRKQETFACHPPQPEPYLAMWRAPLTRLVTELTSAGIDRQHLTQAFARLLEDVGLPLSPHLAPRTAAVPDLLNLMRQIEPAADHGALVTFRELRRAAALEKGTFDAAVLDLARQGRLMLHRHDHPAGLTPQEREQLVTDGAGNYYVGAAIRRATP